jgi:glycosyltransferase involved in cell wall biosynthesis
MKTARFWSYDPGVPSFRLRLAPVAAALAARGWRCTVERLPRGRRLRRVVERRGTLAQTDLLVLHKLNLAPGEGPLLRRWAPAVAFDVDDAIYLRKPRRLGDAPGDSWLRRRKFAASCRAAGLVLAGNPTLAAAVPRADAAKVALAPTPVDVGRYTVLPAAERRPHTLVWIGLAENLFYLDAVRPVLAALARRYPRLVLRVVSSSAPVWDDPPVEHVAWSEAGEAAALATAGVGLMPLADDAWTRGKCAFKLLQYMAAGLPCVASPVGANRDAVVDGETGLLAADGDGWRRSLERLLDDPARGFGMGCAGRRKVETEYATAVVSARVADRLEALAAGRRWGEGEGG